MNAKPAAVGQPVFCFDEMKKKYRENRGSALQSEGDFVTI